MRRVAMQCQSRIAVGAVGYPAAIGALHSWGKAAAIEENQYLITRSDMSSNCLEAGIGQSLLLLFGIKVDHANGGPLSADCASRQAQMLVAVVFGIVKCFQCRGGGGQ